MNQCRTMKNSEFVYLIACVNIDSCNILEPFVIFRDKNMKFKLFKWIWFQEDFF